MSTSENVPFKGRHMCYSEEEIASAECIQFGDT